MKTCKPAKGNLRLTNDSSTSLGYNKCATVISAYAPTMTNLEEVKKRFCDELDTVIKAVSKLDKLLLLGNFNARVGSDHHPWNSHWLPRHWEV